jgi:hypothetical protein
MSRHASVSRSFIAFICAASCCLGAPGCSSRPEIVEVSGRLTRNGQPVGNLIVNFQPDAGRPSWGRADENGSFTLSYDPENDGARVGMHTVYVKYKPGSMAEEMGQLKVKHHPDEAAILEKYGDLSTSPLRIEITDEVADLELKLD